MVESSGRKQREPRPGRLAFTSWLVTGVAVALAPSNLVSCIRIFHPCGNKLWVLILATRQNFATNIQVICGHGSINQKTAGKDRNLFNCVQCFREGVFFELYTVMLLISHFASRFLSI